jgi:hypothetical protein
MTQSTAAISLAQQEILYKQVERSDRMVRLLIQPMADAPGVAPLPILDYLDVPS